MDWVTSWFNPGEGKVEPKEEKEQKDEREIQQEQKLHDILGLIRAKNESGMKQLLTDRTYLDKVCEGTTMLLEAVRIGSLEMVKILIEMGADVNCSNGITTPLIDAIKVKSLALVDYLLYSGADINAPDKKNKETPLFHAVTNSTPTDTSIIQHLLKRNETL